MKTATLATLIAFCSALPAQVPDNVKKAHEETLRNFLGLVKKALEEKKLDLAAVHCAKADIVPKSSEKSLELAFEMAVKGWVIADAMPKTESKKDYWSNKFSRDLKTHAAALDLSREERDKRIEAIKKELAPLLPNK